MRNFLCSVVVAFFILIASPAANAQCVACSPTEVGYSCISETSGGNSCNTSTDRRSCTVTGLCGVKKPKVLSDNEFYRPITFSQNTILNVATLHPRLAETLIQLQGTTLAQLDSGQISWMPGEVYYEDIKQMLDPNSDKESLTKTLQIRDKNAFERGYKPISYMLIVEKSSNGRAVTLRIQRKDTFASFHDGYSSLEITIDITNSTSLTDSGAWKLR
jgi:hypothetical protein